MMLQAKSKAFESGSSERTCTPSSPLSGTGRDLVFMAGDEPRQTHGFRIEREKRFIDHSQPRRCSSRDAVRIVPRKVSEAARHKAVRLALARLFKAELTGQDVDEALRLTLQQDPTGIELQRHLREGRAVGCTRVHNRQPAGERRERGPHECVRRLQKVIARVCAARMAETMHGSE